ncbi:TonB-dependent receptor [Pedobacter punctiformis]|uniref:Carboxypeptidase-like regulatory domain-containing protein n=1 Tax=Pedobacter punctiformis TaxID=3004097 RepID=A0ABT4LD60_9SPHI|nr:carboxypeptidase-like regulatory domain-containing protein [Pedobacter sp. HCMS5-2]MCZ4245816.1 carboxypeptidase-like regulatory domain-containing protein [Pedobacter sp. HCMS5-2]
MRKLYILMVFSLLSMATASAQKQIKGKVKDSNGKGIESANVNLKDLEGNLINFTRSNSKGEFTIQLKSDEVIGYSIEASSIGYKRSAFKITDLNNLPEIVLQGSETNLETVTVKNRPSLSSNGDTLNYRPSDFADKQDRSIGDVLKKMPGVEVAEDGKISYNGKSISSLYVDGDNLLDDKYNIGTKSIPKDAVDKVQVIQNDQPVKMLRKNNTSDDVALNLVLKDEAKLKVMGDATAGAGTPDRFDENLTAMLFNKKLKFINNIKGNNIGVDPGIDLTSHNLSDYLKKLDNDKPNGLLSTGAAGVPSLPQSRYLFNKAGLINLNNLYKFNADLQLRANLYYLYDERKQQYNKFSETYLPGQTIRYTEFQNNEINPQKLRGQFNLNGNADKYYLNNNLVVDYIPFKTTSSVNINGTPANQLLKQQTLDLSNEFNFRRKLKSENIINLYSYLNRTTQPEELNIMPGLNADILNNGIPYAGLNQYLSLPTWYTNNYFSFALVKNRFTQTYKAGFNVQSQELNSSLYRIQNNQDRELVSANAVNDLTWLKTKFYTEASYDYTGEKIKAGVSLPLSYNRINYDDPSNALNKNLNRVFLNPSFNFKYQTGIENYVTANYSFKNDLGGIDDVYRGTVLKNYRSLFANDAPISESKSHSINAGFNFRKAMQMFFFNLNANYTNTQLNTISSYTLNNNIQQRVVLPMANRIKSLFFNANASKYLFALKSTVTAGISFSQNDYQQLQNNDLLPITSQSISYKAGIEARLASFITWSYNASYAVTDNKAKVENSIKTNFQQLRQQSTLSFTTFKNVFVNLSAEHLFTHQSSQPNLKYLFADANIKYKLEKMKTDLEFGLTNLTNIKTFDAVYLSANSLTSGSYLIPGRVAMLKARFNF